MPLAYALAKFYSINLGLLCVYDKTLPLVLFPVSYESKAIASLTNTRLHPIDSLCHLALLQLKISTSNGLKFKAD
jgi:hypothetical protein